MEAIGTRQHTRRATDRSLLTSHFARSDEVPEVLPSAEDVDVASEQLNSDGYHEQIRTVAYYRSELRGFEPGHELDDWLAAEQDVRYPLVERADADENAIG
jgi:hypothetical protein